MREIVVFVPEENELTPLNANKIFKGKMMGETIKKNKNLSQYNIYQDKLLVFYCHDGYSNKRLKFLESSDNKSAM